MYYLVLFDDGYKNIYHKKFIHQEKRETCVVKSKWGLCQAKILARDDNKESLKGASGSNEEKNNSLIAQEVLNQPRRKDKLKNSGPNIISIKASVKYFTVIDAVVPKSAVDKLKEQNVQTGKHEEGNLLENGTETIEKSVNHSLLAQNDCHKMDKSQSSSAASSKIQSISVFPKSAGEKVKEQNVQTGEEGSFLENGTETAEKVVNPSLVAQNDCHKKDESKSFSAASPKKQSIPSTAINPVDPIDAVVPKSAVDNLKEQNVQTDEEESLLENGTETIEKSVNPSLLAQYDCHEKDESKSSFAASSKNQSISVGNSSQLAANEFNKNDDLNESLSFPFIIQGLSRDTVNLVSGEQMMPVLDSDNIDLKECKILTSDSISNLMKFEKISDESLIVIDGINGFERGDLEGNHSFGQLLAEDAVNDSQSYFHLEPESCLEDLNDLEMDEDCEMDDLIKDRSYIPPDDESTEEEDEADENYEEVEESQEQKMAENNQSSINKSFSSSFTISGKSAISEFDLQPEVSQGASGKGKKHFCYYCHKLFFEIARHLGNVHKDEALVKNFLHYPTKSLERRGAIDIIRKKGDGLYNRDSDYNKGTLLTVRRVQTGKNRNAGDFVNCPNCDGFYAKNNIRHHYQKCSGNPPSTNRTLLQEARRKLQRIHPDANSKMRNRIIPILKSTDNVSFIVRYDRLIILYGNLLCVRHKEYHQDNFIRAQIRLLGRFLVALKQIQKDVDDLASAYNPTFFEHVLSAVNKVAEFNDETQTYKTPYNASALGTALRKCGEILKVEYIISKEKTRKESVEDFMIVFNARFGVYINKNVAETMKNREREKRVELPSVEDVQTLCSYVNEEIEPAYASLKNEYSFASWLHLSEMVLLHLLIFNRRRRGEMQFLKVRDFENPTRLTETDELYQDLSEENRKTADNYIRLLIRGKLNRPVPVLVDQKTMDIMQLLKKYRQEAGITHENPYFFALPSNNKNTIRSLDACKLIRKTSELCGAKRPSTLRFTEFRKQFATTCVRMNMTEADIGYVANFMGHEKEIHKGIYRQPTVAVDIIKMSSVLKEAQKAGPSNQQDISYSSEVTEDNVEIQESRADSIISQGKSAKRRLDYAKSDSDSDSEMSKKQSNSKNKKQKFSSDVNSRNESFTGRRKCTKKIPWTFEEVVTIKKIFGNNISMEKLPSNKEIKEAQEKYPCFNKRNVATIKTWLHNQIRIKRNKKL